MTSRYRPPRRSSRLRLGMQHAGAYDIGSGCSGFVYFDGCSRGGDPRPARHATSCPSSPPSGSAARSTCRATAQPASFWPIARRPWCGPSEEQGIGPNRVGSDGSRHDTVAIDAGSPVLPSGGPGGLPLGDLADGPDRARERCKRAGVDPSELAAFVRTRRPTRRSRSAWREQRRHREGHRHVSVQGRRSRWPCRRTWSSAARSVRAVLLLGFGSGLRTSSARA